MVSDPTTACGLGQVSATMAPIVLPVQEVVIVYIRFSRCAEGVAACLVWTSAGADPAAPLGPGVTAGKPP